MPIEIKELLVQAKLREDGSGKVSEEAENKLDATDDDAEEYYGDTDRTEEIIEACLERVKSWFKEQQLR